MYSMGMKGPGIREGFRIGNFIEWPVGQRGQNK